MKTKINIFTKLAKGLLKISLVLLLSIFLLFFLVAGAVQVPAIQNYLVDKATVYAAEVTGYKISIGGIHIDWYDVLVLEEAVLWDKQNEKMIYLGEAEVDYTILSLLKGNLQLDNILLRDGEINLIRHVEEDDINITAFIWKIQELTEPKVKRVGPPIPIVIPRFTLDNMLFSYDDRRKPPMEEDFDYYHFNIDSISGVVNNVYAVLDTIMLDADQLSARLASSNLKLHELTTSFLLDKHQIQCSKLYAKIGESEVRDYFRFEFKDINDLSDFNEKVTIQLQLKLSTIAVDDLKHFAPSLNGINDTISISCKMAGRVNRFSLDSLSVNFGKTGFLKGKMTFDGLPYVSETFMDINLSEVEVTATDLVQYSGISSYDFINKFGKIKGKGGFIGVVNDFAVKGYFNTGLGALSPDLNFKINEQNNDKSSYNGILNTTNFNLGKFLGIDFIQSIDMKSSIDGVGFTVQSVKCDIKASIDRLGLYGYDYKNIETNANFSDEFFDGYLKVQDTNLVLETTGKINMKSLPEEFDIKGKIEKANLDVLNLSDVLTHLSTDFNLNFKGTNIDSILGYAELNNTTLIGGEKELFITKFKLEGTREDSRKTIRLNSDIMNATMTGNYHISDLLVDVPTLFKEYKLYYDQDKQAISDYYLSKSSIGKRAYFSDFKFEFKDINRLVDLYFPGIYISQNTFVKGDFSVDKYTKFNLLSNIDTLFYKGNELYTNSITISMLKESNRPPVEASVLLSSKSQKYKNSITSANFNFGGNWKNEQVDFSTTIEQLENSNKISLNGVLLIADELKKISFTNSSLDLLEEHWAIEETSSINYNEEVVMFNNFKILNKDQSISLAGEFSKNEDTKASLTIQNFNLKNINPLSSYKLGGVLNGQMNFKNIVKDLDLNARMSISAFTVDDFKFGNINGSADWVEHEQQLNVNVDVLMADVKVVTIAGNIKPPTAERREVISLLANLNAADLGIVSPILKGVMSDLSGTVNGSLRIDGNLKDLRVKGDAKIDDGKFKVDYLGAIYTFSDRIYFTEDQIQFKNTVLNDINGNKGTINGSIAHDGFKNFVVDIKGKYKNFNVLNTSEKDNALFYGMANVTGNFSLFGPFEDLEIRANAKSEKETRIYIPLNGGSEVSQKDFIQFKSKSISSIKKDSILSEDTRIRMFFNLEITPDAYTEIIFDKRSGDIIRGRGEGNIELRYDTKGDMTMFGNYVLKEGWYNFTMANIISKEFVIDKGSRLSWNGNPYDGTLDIKAKYNQYVSLKPLFDSTSNTKSDLQRNYPTDVVLGVKGVLSAPEISMDIDILRYPSDPQLATVVTDFEAKIKTNDQELNRQVFSLIMLRMFLAPSGLTGMSSLGINNVSELLSGQLSHFLSQADQNLEINVNLNSLDKDALNAMNFRFSYTAMAGRLRITRDGSFQNTQAASQTYISNIAGEWTVEYMLNKDGNFRIKLFNRINNNALISATGTTSTTAGVSFMHTQSFDSLRDIFGKKKRKKKEEKENAILNDSLPEIPPKAPKQTP